MFFHDEPRDGCFEVGKDSQVCSSVSTDGLKELCVHLLLRRNKNSHPFTCKGGFRSECDPEIEDIYDGEANLGPSGVDKDMVLANRIKLANKVFQEIAACGQVKRPIRRGANEVLSLDDLDGRRH